jgi:hypothetical protein
MRSLTICCVLPIALPYVIAVGVTALSAVVAGGCVLHDCPEVATALCPRGWILTTRLLEVLCLHGEAVGCLHFHGPGKCPGRLLHARRLWLKRRLCDAREPTSGVLIRQHWVLGFGHKECTKMSRLGTLGNLLYEYSSLVSVIFRWFFRSCSPAAAMVANSSPRQLSERGCSLLRTVTGSWVWSIFLPDCEVPGNRHRDTTGHVSFLAELFYIRVVRTSCSKIQQVIPCWKHISFDLRRTW